MNLTFTTPLGEKQGFIADLLKRSYAELVSSGSLYWLAEAATWDDFDREVFQFPDTVGACTFLTWSDRRLIGFASYDPRQSPTGIVGHNCVLPDFRGKGFGRMQIEEILRRFAGIGIHLAKVTTNDHPFFIPAQHMYRACGFREVKRVPWERCSSLNPIEYEKEI